MEDAGPVFRVKKLVVGDATKAKIDLIISTGSAGEVAFSIDVIEREGADSVLEVVTSVAGLARSFRGVGCAIGCEFDAIALVKEGARVTNNLSNTFPLFIFFITF